MLNTTPTYVLPERFAFDEDTSLKVFLRENTGVSIAVSAQNVRKADSLLFQYLIAAARAWSGAGLSFALTEVPSALASDLKLLGIGTETLSWKVEA